MSDPLDAQDRHAARLDARRERLAARRDGAACASSESTSTSTTPQPSTRPDASGAPRRRVLEVRLERQGWRIRDLRVVDPLEAGRQERLTRAEQARERGAA